MRRCGRKCCKRFGNAKSKTTPSFLKNDLLFAYFEYRGDDIKSDLEKMASDPKTQEWWALTGPMQEPLPDREDGEWWATMDEVFRLE